jgi:protein TonB
MVTESSGSRRLDEAALKTLRRISPFQPIPEALARDAWSITVPIAFHLNG